MPENINPLNNIEEASKFVENATVNDIETQLGKPVIIVQHNGSDLAEKLASYFKEHNEH